MLTSEETPNPFESPRRSLRQRKAPSTPSFVEESPVKRKISTPKSRIAKKSDKENDVTGAKNWGRSWDISIWTTLGCILMLSACPLMVIFFWMSCNSFECSATAPFQYVLDHSVAELVSNHFPKPTVFGFQLYFGWLLFQALLYTFLPGSIGYGQMTPAGHKLPYIVNGLTAWVLTHALFLVGSLHYNLFPASIIADNFGPLLIAANCYGYFLTVFAYIKAYTFPSHPADRKFSSSPIFDFFMGIEFNPRFGKYFDFKLFHNGRPGIVAWTLINLSFAAAQYSDIGYVTNSMLLLNVLHAIYVVDFFYHEDWYLRTIDIAHDHFGFYLAWGDSVWLPYMYTFQSHFLLKHPLDLTTPFFTFVAAMGLIGYYIFRTVNNQKDVVRTSNGNCIIWGKPATYIRTQYTTTDGKVHGSLLLTSGYWGISRHFNYVGDLLMSLAMCLTCGTDFLLPFFYIIYMSILLGTRIERDHERCLGKYGKFWEQYCEKVPAKLIPYIY